jgi:hypothetical protein
MKVEGKEREQEIKKALLMKNLNSVAASAGMVSNSVAYKPIVPPRHTGRQNSWHRITARVLLSQTVCQQRVAEPQPSYSGKAVAETRDSRRIPRRFYTLISVAACIMNIFLACWHYVDYRQTHRSWQ